MNQRMVFNMTKKEALIMGDRHRMTRRERKYPKTILKYPDTHIWKTYYPVRYGKLR